VTLAMPTWETVCHHKTSTCQANPCTKFDNSIFGYSRKI